MEFIIVLVILSLIMLLYFKVAGKYKILDKPNHRSAHSDITIRGGGIVIPVAFLLFFVSLTWGKLINLPLEDAAQTQNFLIFGLGLLVICAISFVDDILDLSRKSRLVFHFIAVTLLLIFLNAFGTLPIYWIPVFYILIIGILNAYNFMDGINGITGLYSLIILGSLLFINQNEVEFTSTHFIIYPILACVVFLFFNFRKKARCFMGDIGSLGIAFWIIALIGLLMMKTGELKWILFLCIYGIEVVFTIIERLKLKENIFEAHRRHLYQLFVNEKNVSHLAVSSVYSAAQLVINIIVLYANLPEVIIFAVILVPSIILYLYVKLSVKKEIISKIN